MCAREDHTIFLVPVGWGRRTEADTPISMGRSPGHPPPRPAGASLHFHFFRFCSPQTWWPCTPPAGCWGPRGGGRAARGCALVCRPVSGLVPGPGGARRGPEGPEGARAGSTASPALNLCPGRGLPGACPGGGVRAGRGGRGVGADPARPGGASLFRGCVRAVQRRHLEGAVRPLGVTLCCREPWAGPQLSAQPGLGDVPGTHPRLPSLSVTPQHQCGECPVGQAPVRSLGSVSTGQATQLLPCSGVGSLRVVTAGRREAERGHAGPCWAERGLRAQPPGLGTWRPALRPSCGAARWGPEGPADMPRGLQCRARARRLLWGSILG